MKYNTPQFENKIISPSGLENKLLQIKLNVPLVFTNGCFDIIHRGHVTYLAQARNLGQSMIVALNTDESVKRQNKGLDRPINCLENRLAVIASLESVNFVTYFDEDTPLNLINKIMPDILVKVGIGVLIILLVLRRFLLMVVKFIQYHFYIKHQLLN